ncbi:MAG: protease modulator HflC [Chloroflexota bacterium]|nr:protease modulator HflC [Chloroflexota bacterium]
MRILAPIVALIIAVVIVGPQTFYTVDETQFVVITRFGEVQRVIQAPGLNVKAPFIDQVNVLDSRILRVDVPPSSMPDVENQFLDIDAYARYRIIDPRSFREVLLNEINAASRISNIVIAELRAEIGQRNRTEIIGGRLGASAAGTISVVEPILDANGTAAREAITRRVRDRSDALVQGQAFGVQILDVRIKRADFPAATEESVFARMRTEREVQAQRLRAEGEEEFLTITADVSRRVEVIAAEAEEASNRLRGEGEGEAIGILAEALERDPELFSFLRSLEAYKQFLQENTTLVLNANSDLFRFLQNPSGNTSLSAPEDAPLEP